MLQIDLYAPVPELGGDLFDFVPFVVPGVVYKDIDRGEGAKDILHDRLQFWCVGEITVEVFRWSAFKVMTILNQRTRGLILNIEKQDERSLLNKGLDDGLADSAGAPGDENNFSLQAAVDS